MQRMHTTESDLKRTSLVLPSEAHEQLKQIAEANHRTFSQEIRHLIDRRIAEVEDERAAA
jgi:predicted DNA-binding protein